jgi:hypothetical protein
MRRLVDDENIIEIYRSRCVTEDICSYIREKIESMSGMEEVVDCTKCKGSDSRDFYG